ncbi:MAG: MFS transporter [Litorimonas sp.]
MRADDTAIATPSKTGWSAYKKYVIGILLVVYTLNFIDRQIIAILSPAIQADFGISDTLLGLLKGFWFAIFYAIFSIPIARLADKKNRVNIVSISIVFWSAMTAICGAAGNFWHLAMARIGVGIGEAGCSPPAHSLVSDYFHKEERATALGIYSLGIPLGSLFGILLGGWLVATIGWRWTFAAVGLPGILLGLVVKLTLKEPKRGAADTSKNSIDSTDAPQEPVSKTSLMETFQTIWAIKSFRFLIYGSALVSFAIFGFNLWMVQFLFRTHELSYAQLTVPLALGLGVGGAIGTVAGGAICDRWVRKDFSHYFTFLAVVHTLSVPFYIFAMWTSSSTMCLVVLFFVFMLHSSVAGPCYALVQNLSPLKMRAFGAALYLFVLSAIGQGFGPVYVGGMSDILAGTMGEAGGLQIAMISLAPFWLLAAIIFWRGRRHIAQDIV